MLRIVVSESISKVTKCLESDDLHQFFFRQFEGNVAALLYSNWNDAFSKFSIKSGVTFQQSKYNQNLYNKLLLTISSNKLTFFITSLLMMVMIFIMIIAVKEDRKRQGQHFRQVGMKKVEQPDETLEMKSLGLKFYSQMSHLRFESTWIHTVETMFQTNRLSCLKV